VCGVVCVLNAIKFLNSNYSNILVTSTLLVVAAVDGCFINNFRIYFR